MLSSRRALSRAVQTQPLSLPRHATPTKLPWWVRSAHRGYADSAESSDTPTSPPKPRYNEIGVQQLPADVRAQLFRGPPPEVDPQFVKLAENHLNKHGLLGKNSDKTPPISVKLPPLLGQTLDEHFYKLGKDAAEPFLGYAKELAAVDLPKPPKVWVRQSGWTKYRVNTSGSERVDSPDSEKTDVPYSEKVDFPDPEEKMLAFDVEVLYKESPFAIMACAASPNYWYVWLSPWLLGETETDKHLIPLGDPTKERVIVGHNVGYDRARILEEYNIEQTKNSFLDTMSLHVAVNGMCSQQRPTWMKHMKQREMREKVTKDTQSEGLLRMLQSGSEEEEAEPWVGKSSINSLRYVAKLHCGVAIDKTVRDEFGTLDRAGIMGRLDALLDYCAADVAISHKVYKIIFPRFLEVCPHPVSFAALRHLSSVTLPVNDSWDEYIENAEKTYQGLLEAVGEKLRQLAEQARGLKQDCSAYEKDDWFRQLDWSGQEIRMTKETKKSPSRPARKQRMPGEPNWYKDLHPKAGSPMNLTVRTRIAPLLLKMAWNGEPLIWSDLHGWTFRVTPDKEDEYVGTPVVKVSMCDEKNPNLREDIDHIYFKIPHKDGPQARCANPLAKGYSQYFQKGILSSEYPLALEALMMNAQCSYWISARERIRNQMVVYEDDANNNLGLGANSERTRKVGMIIPQLIPMGTITRRAVERTWLTASNAKGSRVGSELKAMVKAPPGYVFVGADVDSEELWIAALIGDAQFKIHGGGALGFMTLEGAKSEGTDLHSKTASILGISRGSAKVFNYGRIYGAGVKFASTLLRQFNPSITDSKAIETAESLYRETKGIKSKKITKLFDRPFWHGGTESLVFNKLEDFAEQEFPRTPVLGAGITEALMRDNISKGGFLTSRINWAIQSSGVDYLHLLLISMDYLIRRYGLNARVTITVHDEVRYLVKEEDQYKVAMALQVANVWTRAMFSQQIGIEDLPQSCAWFSGVDIDRVLRKEVDLDCVTPSHPDPIEPGECVDIQQLLAKGEAAVLDDSKPLIDLSEIPYEPRTPVMEQLGANEEKEKVILQLRAQIANEVELKDVFKDWQELQGPDTSGPGGWDDEHDGYPRAWPGAGFSSKSNTKKRATTSSSPTAWARKPPLNKARSY